MESLSREALVRFVRFVYENDCQILANRREAQGIFNQAILGAEGLAPADTISYPVEKAEKIQTFLALQQTEAGPGNQVNVYAFIRLVGELRRRISAGGAVVGTPPGTPSVASSSAPDLGE